jgi:hypothetical protein
LGFDSGDFSTNPTISNTNSAPILANGIARNMLEVSDDYLYQNFNGNDSIQFGSVNYIGKSGFGLIFRNND